eukprot:169440-Chlamydomonas_euryale.AAC.2
MAAAVAWSHSQCGVGDPRGNATHAVVVQLPAPIHIGPVTGSKVWRRSTFSLAAAKKASQMLSQRTRMHDVLGTQALRRSASCNADSVGTAKRLHVLLQRTGTPNKAD